MEPHTRDARSTDGPSSVGHAGGKAGRRDREMDDKQAHEALVYLYNREVSELPRDLVASRYRSGGVNVHSEGTKEQIYGTEEYYGAPCSSLGWREEYYPPVFPAERKPAPYAYEVATHCDAAFRAYADLRRAGYLLRSEDDTKIVEWAKKMKFQIYERESVASLEWLQASL